MYVRWFIVHTVSTDSLQYFWNRHLVIPFFKAGFSSAIVPIMQGFIGQRPFVVKGKAEDTTKTEASTSLESEMKADRVEIDSNQTRDESDSTQPFLLTLVSRRSVKRSGLRYLRRGIDDEGNCANMIETEQILSHPVWQDSAKIRSFVQLRASIPLYFSQSPYAFKPVPVLHQSPEINRKAFDRHFDELRRRYGPVHVVLLVNKQGGRKG